MQTEPQKEHQWLQKLVGEWTLRGRMQSWVRTSLR